MRSRRCGCAVLATVMASAISLRAQTPQLPQTMLPVPPLPAIGLPLPHIGLPPAEPSRVATDAEHAAPGLRASVRGNARRPYPVAPVVYLLPGFLVADPTVGAQPPSDSAPDATVERAPASAQPMRSGTLTFDVRPSVDTQIFVDRYYVGTTEQIGTSVEMAAGPHVVELKADGYEPLRFAVRIGDGQSLTYREALKPIDATPTTKPMAPAAPVTLYVIAGCYAGSTPPDPAALPSRCDIAQLKTILNR